jgi:hypothetical protein
LRNWLGAVRSPLLGFVGRKAWRREGYAIECVPDHKWDDLGIQVMLCPKCLWRTSRSHVSLVSGLGRPGCDLFFFG